MKTIHMPNADNQTDDEKKTQKLKREHYEELSNGFFNHRHRNVRNIVIQILGSQLA